MRLLEDIGVIKNISEFQHRPCIIIHRRENHAVAQELVSGFPHVRNVHAHQRRYVLHVQSFVVLWAIFQRLIYPPRCHADTHQLLLSISRISSATITDFAGVPVGSTALGFNLIQWAFDEVEMDVRCFEKVVCNLHFISDGSYYVGADVASVVESLQAAPDTGPFVLDELWF